MGEKLQIYIFSPQLVFANQSCLIWNWDQVNLFIQTNGVLLGNQSIWKHLRNIYFQLKRLKFNNHQEKNLYYTVSFNSSSVTTSPAVDYTPSKSHKALKGTAGNISCCCSTRRLFLISRVDQQLIELFLTLVREQCEQKAALGTASAYRCTWESRHNKSRAAGSALCGADRSAGVCEQTRTAR